VLKNLEVIIINQAILKTKEEILKLWNGNVILNEEGNIV